MLKPSTYSRKKFMLISGYLAIVFFSIFILVTIAGFRVLDDYNAKYTAYYDANTMGEQKALESSYNQAKDNLTLVSQISTVFLLLPALMLMFVLTMGLKIWSDRPSEKEEEFTKIN